MKSTIDRFVEKISSNNFVCDDYISISPEYSSDYSRTIQKMKKKKQKLLTQLCICHLYFYMSSIHSTHFSISLHSLPFRSLLIAVIVFVLSIHSSIRFVSGIRVSYETYTMVNTLEMIRK